MIITKIKYSILGLVMLGIVLMSGVSFVHANPSLFLRSVNSSSVFPLATTTTTYFNGGGLSTTTLALDLGVNGAQAADSASLLVQLTSTTSQPVLNMDVQYSQDGVDWYASAAGTDFPSYASSTPTIGQVESLQFIYASSTINRGNAVANGTATSSTNRIVNLKTPTRYIRIVNYISPGSNTAALLWEEIVAKRQAP